MAPFGQVALSIIVIKGPAAAFALACCPATKPRRRLTGISRETLSGFAQITAVLHLKVAQET